MNIAEWSIKNPLICGILTLILLVGGYMAYNNMPRFEDPEFTIRAAKIFTQYPGASPEEVMNEVTEPLETALQQLPEVKEVTSISSAGLSDITVTIKFESSKTKSDLALVWTKVRNKVEDARGNLPPDAGKPIVNDGFGDVFGLYYLITGDGYTSHDLLHYAKTLRKDLLLVNGVAKVEIMGEQKEAIYIEVSQERAASLGVSLNSVYATLAAQNTVSSAGDVVIGSERLMVQPTGSINSVEAIKNTIIGGFQSGSVVRLGDVANVYRAYQEPRQNYTRYDGKPAIALGVSNMPGTNVVKMGADIDAQLKKLEPEQPAGIELHEYYHQGKVVDTAIQAFASNVFASLAIVFCTLLVFMGFRSGLIMGITVLVTMAATLLIMWLGGVPMHRISLGALIISLGMLVDNGVVVTDGILVGLEKGRNKLEVAKEVASQNILPLLCGTLVGVIAFAPIGFAPGETAEFTGDLFWVVLIALGLSWFLAFTLTPLLCYWIFPDKLKPKKKTKDGKPSAFLRAYQGLIKTALRFRWVFLALVVGVFLTAGWGFQFVKNGFFPESTSPQIAVDFQLPKGTDIEVTNKDLTRLTEHVQSLEGVKHVHTLVGGGAMRYMLTYEAPASSSAVGQILVQTDSYQDNPRLVAEIQQYLDVHFPDASGKAWMFQMGPGGGSKIEATFSGPDPKVLRGLVNQAKTIMAQDGGAILVKDDWGRQQPYIAPDYNANKGQRLGISRNDMAKAIAENFSGVQRGVYREGEDLIPIISRAPEQERTKLLSLASLSILSPVTNQSVPLAQVADFAHFKWRDSEIRRKNRILTMKAQCDPQVGVLADVLYQRLKPQIEAIELPEGYSLKWDGEFGSSSEAQEKLASTLPMALLAMVLTVVFLFNKLRQPIIIWAVVPLGIIGVVIGLILTDLPLEFMAMLGVLSLSGLLIQNSLILVDSTDTLIAEGMPRFDALIESATSRLRPVTMGAFTTVLGIVPLYMDAFFKSMTVVLAFGLTFATLITLLVTPVLYSLFFGIKKTEVAAS